MKKEQLLQELEERLKGIPPEDREKLIELYEDLIDVAQENRKNQPLETATLEDEFRIPMEYENGSYRNLGRVILASVSLFLFNSIFVLGPAIAIVSMYLSLWIVSLCFVISPLLVIGESFIYGFQSWELFLSIALCGVGLALGGGMIPVGRALYRVTKKYVNWNIHLIKGE